MGRGYFTDEEGANREQRAREAKIRSRVVNGLTPYLQTGETLIECAEVQVGGRNPILTLLDATHAAYFRLYYVGVSTSRLLMVRTSHFLPDRFLIRKRVYIELLAKTTVQQVTRPAGGFLSVWIWAPSAGSKRLNFEPGWLKEGETILDVLAHGGRDHVDN